MADIKSPLLDEGKKVIETPPYSDDESAYLSRLLTRCENAITMKEQEHPEYDGMTYSDEYDQNQRLANTFIEPKKNPEDSNFQSGTARDKMFALLSALNNLNLSPDISAFDKNNIQLGSFGEAMEDIMLKTEEIDGDEEKKHLRQVELLTQGHVFVEEIWDERWMMDKKIINGRKFTGQIKGLNWTSKLKRAFSKPSRNMVSGLAVFLGNIRQYDFNLQPYIFTLDVKDYLETEEIFSEWERWQYVPKTFTAPKLTKEGMTYDSGWKILNIENGQCVIIKYQDPWNNEYALIINGVLMTPVGLPLSAVNGFNGYNITQQNLEPIHSKFAYGNSLMRRLRTKVGLLDEMIRLSVLKTQQSYKPPYLNLSGRILSQKIFGPGKITQGADLSGKLIPLLGTQQLGLTNPEMAMIAEIKEQINNSSVNPTFQGQKSTGDPTATEVVELQRQAKLMLGLTIFACSLMEWKISWLRLFNILAKWFDPFDQVVEEVKNELVMKDMFHKVSVERPIEGEGMGMRMVVPTKETLPTKQEIYDAEEILKKQTGKPTRLIFLNPDEIKNSKIIWQITIKPREKITNELSKLMFRAEMNDAQLFGQMINMDYLAERFALIWGENPNKLFKKAPPIPMAPAERIGAAGVKVPGMPTAEQAAGLGKQVIQQ